MLGLPPCIIDAELVGWMPTASPTSAASWRATRTATARLVLRSVVGRRQRDVRREPLEERRARLEGLLAGADADLLHFSEVSCRRSSDRRLARGEPRPLADVFQR